MKVFLQQHKPFEKYFKIKFFKPEVRIHANGFISVEVSWKSKQECIDFWRFKYPEISHTSYGGDIIEKRKRYFTIRSASFEFPELKEEVFDDKRMTSWFDICLVADTMEEADENEFEYIFFNKTKYGVIAWFAPKGWEDWDNTKPLL